MGQARVKEIKKMWLNQIFSLINDNEIKNIIVCDNYELAQQLARETLGSGAIAIDTTLYAVSVGDIYENGLFYRKSSYVIDGIECEEKIEIPKNKTEAESIELLKAENEELKTTVSNLENSTVEGEIETDLRLSMLELGLA